MKLIGRTGWVAGRDVDVPAVLRIGAAEDNDFRLVVRGVSRHHARVVRDGSDYFIEDAGSTNGTFLNGQRITRERLEHLDVITLGRDIDLIAVESSPQGGTTAGLPVRTITEAWFEWLDGPETGARVDVAPGELTIGRVAPSNVIVDSAVVSQIQMKIVRSLDSIVLQDLASANGTFVNARRIVEPAILRNNDVVSVAGIRQFRMRIVGDTTRLVAQNVVMSQSLPSHAREWQTRLVWSADELAQLEAERQRAMEDIRQVTGGSPAAPAAPTPAKGGARPIAPRPAAAAKPEAKAAPPKPDAKPMSSTPEAKPVPAKVEPKPAPKAEAVSPPVSPEPPAPPSPPPPLPATPAQPAAANQHGTDSIAKQAPGPKSAIPFVPPAGSIEFREADTKKVPQPAQEDVVAARGPVAPKVRGIKLSGNNGDFELGLGDHIIGRGDNIALRIRNPQVSRHHATLRVTEEGATLEDSKSGNGTFVNMQRIQGPAVPIGSGDMVSFGSVEFTVELLT